MNALTSIYRDQLSEAPKKKKDKSQTGYSSHLGWVFVCNRFNEKPKAIRTYHSLYSVAEAYTYFTPNTFYRNDSREQATLRWVNALSVDIDVKNGQNERLTVPEVLDQVTAAGLETPSLIVQTPSGGFHVHWFLEAPKRAFKPVIKHYERVQRLIATAIKGDVQAVGAERWFRMPTEQNTVFQSEARISFDSLCDWYSIQVEEQEEERKAICVNASSLLSHPAIRHLLNGVEEGQRDNTCYTLALAFKVAGYDEMDTEGQLQDWNTKNTPSLCQIDIKRKVKSAFKPGAPAAPSSYWICTLSGMPFAYQTWEEAKPRTERKYSHYSEWEEDVIAHIQFRGGSISGSQRDLAEEIRSSANKKQTISYSTFKRVIDRLVNSGQIAKIVEGKGRGQVTTLTIQEQSNVVEMTSVASVEAVEDTPKENGLNSNTFIDQVVGGAALSSVGAGVILKNSPTKTIVTYSSSPLLAPIPTNVPDRFVSALWNRGFKDGRFIFGAWGKVQLAFKAYSIPYKAIAGSVDYMQLVSEAVELTAVKKGSNLDGDFNDSDSFFKYLYGTVKGLLANYRAEELACFVESIEGLYMAELLSIGCDLEEQLQEKQVVDRGLLEEKLFELEREESAVRRREVARKRREKGLTPLLFDWVE
ncbi:primase C-terminal domain-containing protein [Peribacillus castrilensis]|uniref:primase C-terminal domain-containing protein n=1 Tax=Bacillaceae TaxID=186817 RepID=UPI00065FCD62|nr:MULTISPECIES: primase C-terminal domain-containing protein [Bacillaceae]MCT1390123.1 primase C-terminal domain-containing protein [Peribacillus frigoritolerans]PRA81597.1 hypothetical protein CQ056_20575 [Peribacillus simplex]